MYQPTIGMLADALQRGDLLPWAVRDQDPLPRAWWHCDDGFVMAAVLAHLHPRRFADRVCALAMGIPLEATPDPRPLIRGLHGVVSAVMIQGAEGAVRELTALGSRLEPGQRDRVSSLLRANVRAALPDLRSEDVVRAVSAR